MKSMRLGLFLTILNVLLSLVVSKVFSNRFDLGQIIAVFGNFTLIFSMALFFYSGAIELTGTARWSSAMEILGLQKSEWKEGDSRRAERKAIIYLLCGAILFGEILILVMFTV